MQTAHREERAMCMTTAREHVQAEVAEKHEAEMVAMQCDTQRDERTRIVNALKLHVKNCRECCSQCARAGVAIDCAMGSLGALVRKVETEHAAALAAAHEAGAAEARTLATKDCFEHQRRAAQWEREAIVAMLRREWRTDVADAVAALPAPARGGGE